MFLAGISCGATIPLTCTPPPCTFSAEDAAAADYKTVWEEAVKLARVRHDKAENASRLVGSTCSCHSAAEPRYRALAGEKGVAEPRGDANVVAVLPRLQLAVVDVWLCMRAHSLTLLRLPVKPSGRRRALKEKRALVRADTFQDVRARPALHAAFCRLRWSRTGAWAGRRRDWCTAFGALPLRLGAIPRVDWCAWRPAAAVGCGAEGGW